MQDYGIVTCSRHLNLTDFEAGASCSIALQGKAKTGYPRVSRGSFLSGYGSFLCYYAHFLYILFPSSRIRTPLKNCFCILYIVP